MSFENLNLNNPLRNALGDLGFEQATPIQEQAFPVIMAGKDLVGVAQTGTGKTFAYLLPLLRLLKFSKQKEPRILIVVPTRELVVQVVKEIEKLTTYMNVRLAGTYGGTNIRTQKKVVEAGLDIIVSTPGRLVDLAMSRSLKLNRIKVLVIDEFDEILNLGFRHQLNNMLNMLPERKQHLLFSATMPEEAKELVDDFFINPKKIVIAPHGQPLEQIEQQIYHVPNFYTKINLLTLLLKQTEDFKKVLVFAGTKRLVDLLHQNLGDRFPDKIGAIHSNKSQNYRLNSVKRFEDLTHRVLIATDIIARGIDISDVTHVINFDTPVEPTNYMHRIGRTGRAESLGKAITFVTEEEIPIQKEIEALMNKAITVLPLPEDLEISFQKDPVVKVKMAGDKHYLKNATINDSQGAFHEKKAKNMKTNFGGLTKQKFRELAWKRKKKKK